MELSSLEGSLLSSIPHRRSPAISRQCVITYNRGFRNSSTKWRRTLDLDRVGLVLSRGVKSKEDLKEDWELDEGEEKSDFWNPLDLLEDLKVKENRDELFAKVDDLKNQIFGDSDD